MDTFPYNQSTDTASTGNRDAAAKDFEDATSHNAEDPDIYYHRAQLHFILSEFSLAATDYQKSIDLDTDFIFSHIQLGVTQYKMGSIASSMATFRRCIKNFGNKSDVYNYYGELLLDQQKYQEAVEKFETAVEMERKGVGERGGGMNVLPLINKALALFQWKQDFGAAEELCQKALISEFCTYSDHTNRPCTDFSSQSIPNATLLLLRWHSCFCSKARSQMLSPTSSAQQSCRELKARSSTHCHTLKRREHSLRCKRSTRNWPQSFKAWAPEEWALR